MNSPPKSVEWIANSLDDLKDFPENVQQAVGYALYRSQCGGKHPSVTQSGLMAKVSSSERTRTKREVSVPSAPLCCLCRVFTISLSNINQT
ncbi:MAG: hypothetical protein KME10_09460 [Plectolyngbya sp. WJT66-NPBG17]|nr:hypothetical protein [Plectolyngbya sp. WJT66-NPBG17]MBW4525710.1 hypothetical protein [Phormidium tanganyikae FI6-MK23]